MLSDVQVLLAELKACSRTNNLERGKQVHLEALACGRDSNGYLNSALIKMYAKCGSMVDARQVFDSKKHQDVVSWTALILGYAENGQGLIALNLLIRMKDAGQAPDSVTFVAALKACTSLPFKRAVCCIRGKQVHNLAVEHGYDSDIYVQNTLIDMYCKCGSMSNANQVFSCKKYLDLVSWNVVILGYAENGQGLTALDLFTRMITEGPAPNYVTIVAVLKACICLALEGDEMQCRDWGKRVHKYASEKGCDSNVYVQNTLIVMYVKCGRMADALNVFRGMKHPDVVAFNVLILGYAEAGQGLYSLDLFRRMKRRCPVPDSATFVAALKACSSLSLQEKAVGGKECWDWGKVLHMLSVEEICDSNIYVRNTLIDMYAKRGSMVNACLVFDSMRQRDDVSWNALILGYADNGQGREALNLFMRMRNEGPSPDFITFSGAFKACALLGALELGRTYHWEIRQDVFNIVLVTCLVDFYAKCGSLVEARRVFDLHAETRDVVTWTALLAGYCSCGDYESVFELFGSMQDAGFQPDSVTFVSIFTCCSHAGLVDKGKECFDAMLTKYGISHTIEHYNCMVDIFGRANKLDDALALLQNTCCSPNDVTWTIILGASRKWRNVHVGKLAFQSLIKFNDWDEAGYMLMGQIYGSRGMLEEQNMVMRMRKKFKFFVKTGETCWTSQVGKVHTFGLR